MARLAISVLTVVATLAFFSPSALAERTVEGKIATEGTTMPSASGPTRKSDAWLSGGFGFEWRSNSSRGLWSSARAKGDFWGEALVSGSDSIGANRTGSANFFEDRELYIEFRGSRTRMSLGSRVLRWGLMDFYDPLDQVNSRRYEKPLKSNKRGEWMLYATWQKPQSRIGAWTIEGYIVPERRPSLLPSQSSPWLPRQLYVPNLPDIEIELPDSIEYLYRYRSFKNDASHTNFGSRVLWRYRSAELAIQFDEGMSSLPAIQPTVSGTVVAVSPRRRVRANSLVVLDEVYYRERHFGGSIAQPLPRWMGGALMRVQIAKTEPVEEGRTLARDRSDAALALERSFSMGSQGSLTVIAQGFNNLLADGSGGNDLASFSSVFDRAGALGLRWAPNETSSISIGALHSAANKGGTVFLAGAAFDLTGALSVEADWTVISAELESPLGPFANNDGGSLKLTYAF